MKVDISRVNFLEKDIEEWLYENPDKLTDGDSCLYWDTENPMAKWIGRQYQLPSGIADLIGVRENGLLVVVEVKNVPINKAAVLQVCRYADDLKYIVSYRMDYPHKASDGEPQIQMILVGPSIDDQTFIEAQSIGIRILQFSVELNLNMAGLNLTREYREKVDEQHISIAARPEWEMYGLTIDEDIEQRLGKGEGLSDIVLTDCSEE